MKEQTSDENKTSDVSPSSTHIQEDKINNDSNEPRPSHYIGIGASAGGLEALQEFFTHIPPNTGASFIVVQHLSPDFKSMMPELLSKNTEMPIYQVSDGLLVEPDSIYLMPARQNMLIADGKLLISTQIPDGNLHLPIDSFMRSLARDQHHKAIGIVLSGTGSDGTRGIKAIKQSDGMVIVQDPKSAKFDGMPKNAYNTGLADMLLSPQEMGINLVKFIQHPFISGDHPSLRHTIGENDDTLSEIFELLRKQSSINFSEYKASTVARRIERRLGINQLSTLDSYLRLLNESPRELQILSKELLIGVTRFFRDEEAFKKITDQIIPLMLEKENTRAGIRIWVAACSSGEEAYSLAMLLDEAVKKLDIVCPIKVFATDVDEDAVAHASTGVYSADVVQDISKERMDHYFIQKEDSVVVSTELRKMVVFAVHNVIEDAPFSNIDLASCRNALIYFQHAAQKRVLSSLYFSLRKEGFLFLGSSESLGDLQSHFEIIDERNRIFRKISNLRVPIGNSPRLHDSTASIRSGMSMPPVAPAMRSARSVGGRGPLNTVLERLIREYAPDCIVLNEFYDAIHVYGDVSKYTRGVVAGKISNNIKDMVIEDLNVAISTALHRCEKTESDVFYEDITVISGPSTPSSAKTDSNSTDDSEQINIDLSIFFVREGESSNSPHYFIVQFIHNHNTDKKQVPKNKISFDPAEQSRQRIQDLEKELIKKQENLHVTVEELETTNEELQSANEELMSANEELQSTNEELQSVNEELYTVNSEYQEKITLLTESNNERDSVMNATDLGIIFLDEQLTIRKFTPPSTRYIHLRQADEGRPFHHISHDLIYDDFLADIAAVSDNGTTIEKEVSSEQDQSLLVRIIPFAKSPTSMQTGVLITITNISRLRFVENALQRAQEQIRSSLLGRTESLHRRIANNEDISLLLLDDDRVDRQRVTKLLKSVANRSFKVTSCSEIDEAAEIAVNNNIDICLLDYSLAGGTAQDFIDKIKPKVIPSIILSGYSEVGLDTDLFNADVFDFLNKDEISSQLLSRSIDYVLERKEVLGAIDNLSA